MKWWNQLIRRLVLSTSYGLELRTELQQQTKTTKELQEELDYTKTELEAANITALEWKEKAQSLRTVKAVWDVLESIENTTESKTQAIQAAAKAVKELRSEARRAKQRIGRAYELKDESEAPRPLQIDDAALARTKSLVETRRDR